MQAPVGFKERNTGPDKPAFIPLEAFDASVITPTSDMMPIELTDQPELSDPLGIPPPEADLSTEHKQREFLPKLIATPAELLRAWQDGPAAQEDIPYKDRVTADLALLANHPDLAALQNTTFLFNIRFDHGMVTDRTPQSPAPHIDGSYVTLLDNIYGDTTEVVVDRPEDPAEFQGWLENEGRGNMPAEYALNKFGTKQSLHPATPTIISGGVVHNRPMLTIGQYRASLAVHAYPVDRGQGS